LEAYTGMWATEVGLLWKAELIVIREAFISTDVDFKKSKMMHFVRITTVSDGRMLCGGGKG
jgi:hypothetical protein